jgi:ketosteroid isomerase-like protein
MPAHAESEDIVRRYFTYIGELRNGVEGSIEKLVDLWDADGTFEFSGAPPVNGSFRGRNAIHVLYKNRFHATGMRLALAGAPQGAEKGMQAALGVVDTEVQRTRVMDGKIVAGWTTIVGTRDGRGFQVAGSHTFTFRDGKISTLKVVVSPRADSPTRGGLRLEDLSVDDIGRLALAAWAVV